MGIGSGGCEMTTIVPAAWQTFRLGLHASSLRRSAFSTLRTVISTPKLAKQPLQHLRIRHRLPQISWGGSVLCQHLRLWRTTTCTSHELGRQSRGVSLWRPSPNEKDARGEEAAANELTISPSEVDKIFGRKMDPEKGIEILMTIQNHRSEGTLDSKMPYSDVLIAKGLTWLRKKDPVNEDAAIIARIDREMFGTRTPQTHVQHSRQAVSQFDKMREEQTKRNKVEEEERDMKEKEKAKESSPETSKTMELRGKNQTSPSNELGRVHPIQKWIQKYQEVVYPIKKRIHKYREEVEMSDDSVFFIPTWRRLLPSALVTVTIVALSILFAANYTPPSRSARILPEIPPAAATAFALIGINCAVFMSWRIPPLWKFMNKTFMVAPVYPYSRSMLGAAFSHQKFGHLFANCFCIWLLGTRSTYWSFTVLQV